MILPALPRPEVALVLDVIESQANAQEDAIHALEFGLRAIGRRAYQ